MGRDPTTLEVTYPVLLRKSLAGNGSRCGTLGRELDRPTVCQAVEFGLRNVMSTMVHS